MLSYRCEPRDVVLRWLAMAVVTVLCLASRTDPALGNPSTRPNPFIFLQQRLIEDGFDRKLIEGIYARSEAAFDRKGIADYFSHREATLDYDQFLTPSSIDQAIAYLHEHGKSLKETERRYGVEGEVVTAILLVESRLGTFIGKHRVINTLSSLAALGELAARDMLWNGYVKGKAQEAKGRFDRWAVRKSDWAYQELKAYLTYVQAQNIDPFSLRGSYAGALGFAQFVPSSILTFGRDGNRDGQVRLHEHPDAIESVANYLNQHGWRPGQERDESLRILLRYNHSTYYAETILKVAERLRSVGRDKTETE
ncbi:MAG: lytic murein transglycosylase [Thermodesulfobacteriota bacterium]|nr:lytic murein transglycosylase [Thermodesulfobacteriota bacterium]